MFGINDGFSRPQGCAELVESDDVAFGLQPRAEHLQGLLLDEHTRSIGSSKITAFQVDCEAVRSSPR